MEDRVDLGSQLESFVEALVEEGRFASRDEVLREGVRVLQEREERFAELEASLMEAAADIDAGRFYDAGEVFDELEAKYAEMAKAQRA
jgi:antitoxin ParD1/3/4